MIAILDCRELKYRIQRKLNHRFGDDIKIKFEHDEAELMRDSQQCDILFIPDRLSLKSDSGYELCKNYTKKILTAMWWWLGLIIVKRIRDICVESIIT